MIGNIVGLCQHGIGIGGDDDLSPQIARIAGFLATL